MQSLRHSDRSGRRELPVHIYGDRSAGHDSVGHLDGQCDRTAPTTTTCSAPAAAGTATTFTNGTAGSYTVTCYSQGFVTASAGNYPASITLASGTLPADAKEATSLSSTPACTTATSGSSVTEEYELECPVTQTPTGADDGSYPVTFLATGGSNGAPNATSGTLDADGRAGGADVDGRPVLQRH